MAIKTTIKQWQLEKNIVDCCYILERFLNNRIKTIELLQLILPVGWKITKLQDGYKYVERTIQCTQSDLHNVYMCTQSNVVRIYNFYPADFNDDYLVVRLNLRIDKDNNITFIN